MCSFKLSLSEWILFREQCTTFYTFIKQVLVLFLKIGPHHIKKTPAFKKLAIICGQLVSVILENSDLALINTFDEFTELEKKNTEFNQVAFTGQLHSHQFQSASMRSKNLKTSINNNKYRR